MAKARIKKADKEKLNFLYGDAWKKNPEMYLLSIHRNDTVRYCEYCGRPLTRSDVNDYGSLCERCYMKEYYND